MILTVPLVLSDRGGATGPALLVLAILAFAPASDLALALVNWVLTSLLGPRVLPRLELAGGVPADLRTLIVVPTLLTDEADVEEQVARLEIHYLGNPEGDLRFALLSDWLDAPTETRPRRRRAALDGRRGDRPAQRPSRRRPRWRGPLPAVPSPAPLERG